MRPVLDRVKARNSSEHEELRATLGEHLEELRQRLLRVLYAFVPAFVVGWIVAMPMYDALHREVLTAIPKEVQYREAVTHLTQPFMLQFRLSAYIALVLCLPVLLSQLWGFVAPGLRPNERRPVQMLTPICLTLFGIGVFLGWVTIPAMVGFFMAFNGGGRFEIIQEPGALVMLVVMTMLGFGLAFQTPVVVFFLTKLGVVTPEGLKGYWRHVVVGNVVAAAVITPGGDVVTLFAMAVPMIVLFYAGMYAATWGQRGGRPAELDLLDAPPC